MAESLTAALILAAMLVVTSAPAPAQSPEAPASEAPAGEAPTEAAPGQAPDAKAAPPPPVPAEGSMTLERVGEIVARLDSDVQVAQGGRMLQFVVAEKAVLFVSDPTHNRMRLMVPVKPATDLSAEELLRLSQANFDSALDARYAVARGVLWAVYIHPLRELHERQFIAAVGQVVNAAESYGTSYSSGLLSFGGGDSNAIRRRALIDELLKQGEPI
ncbi:MAG: hypothetical protein AAF074_25505 [Pseudomonadota bacterium]